MKRSMMAALSAAGVVVAVACSDDGDATDTRPTTVAPPTTVADTAIVPSESVTTGPPGDADEPNWVRIVQRLDDKLVEFYADPNGALERIHELCLEGSPCDDTYTTQFKDAVDRGEYVEGWNRYTVLDVEVDSTDGVTAADSERITVEVTLEPDGDEFADVVDEDGNVLGEIAPGRGDEFTERWYLAHTDNGWRLSQWEADI